MNDFVLRFKIDASNQMHMGYHWHVYLRNKDTQWKKLFWRSYIIYDVLINNENNVSGTLS